MKALFFTLFFFFVLIPLVLGIIIPIYKKHYKTSRTINYDSLMRKFVYKVEHPKEYVIRALQTNNNDDELTCNIDIFNSVIEFSDSTSQRKYHFWIEELDGFFILKLEQCELIGMSSNIPYKLNPFMVKRINAEIIPFSQYHF